MSARACLAGLLLLLVAAGSLTPYDPAKQQREEANAAPSVQHWFGTDGYGRDVASRFLAGGRWSVLAGAAAAAATLGLGWIVGSAAGWWGGAADLVLMRVAEVFLVLPWLYLLLAIRALLPLETPPRTAAAVLLLAVAAVSWARPARLVRGMVLGLKERGYVEAARGFGVPGPVIWWRHVLPGTLPLLFTQWLVLFPRFVLLDVTLSLLGLGVAEPAPSWGALLVPLKQAWMLPREWWVALPALLVAVFFAVFSLLARKSTNGVR